MGEDASFGQALDVVTRSVLGGVSITDDGGRLTGIMTDGDVRRAIQAAKGEVAELLQRPVRDMMTRDPVRVPVEALAMDALRLMERNKPRPIYLLPVVDHDAHPVGLLHLHTLVQAGLTSEVDEHV